MSANIRLYNTLTRQKEVLKPLLRDAADKEIVRMYVCGPTVYDFAHIGNARPVIVFDVLFRLLRHVYGEKNVIYTRNITDVDDKINDRAARDFPGLPLNDAIRRVTESTNAQFQADVEALGCLEPIHQPRATEHIEGMKAIIQKLLDKGFAYVAEGGEGKEVLFAVQSMPRYGQLSNRKLDEQEAGARVAVEAHKRNASDFVLWKQSTADQPGWDASFNGVAIFGRPGWHIECSAMSMAKLLEPFGGGLTCDDPLKNTFDIHGGGIDLVFPHHENEIAQSCCAFGQPGQPNPLMASIWMHNGFLQVEGQKMSKSLGNFVTIADVLKDWPGKVARLNMLRTNYRQPIDWTEASLRESEAILDKWADAGLFEGVVHPAPKEVDQEFVAALSDDLNTPKAIARLHSLSAVASGSTAEANAAKLSLKASLALIGVDKWVGRKGWSIGSKMLMSAEEKAHIDALIALRNAARAAKNWTESDRIRAELATKNIQVKDFKREDGSPDSIWEELP
jgi:cysteinyl-tRNA synthetase